jgi:hypothetical protein
MFSLRVLTTSAQCPFGKTSAKVCKSLLTGYLRFLLTITPPNLYEIGGDDGDVVLKVFRWHSGGDPVRIRLASWARSGANCTTIMHSLHRTTFVKNDKPRAQVVHHRQRRRSKPRMKNIKSRDTVTPVTRPPGFNPSGNALVTGLESVWYPSVNGLVTACEHVMNQTTV